MEPGTLCRLRSGVENNLGHSARLNFPIDMRPAANGNPFSHALDTLFLAVKRIFFFSGPAAVYFWD